MNQHFNEGFIEVYRSIGKPYQKRIIKGLDIQPHTLSNWLSKKAKVPYKYQDTITRNALAAYSSLLSNLGFTNPIYMSIFKKGETSVRAMRQLKKMSQQELADATELTQVTISNVESGKVKLGSLDTARRIANFFGLPIEAFKDFN